VRVRVVVGAALALVAVAVVVTLSQSRPRLAGSNGVRVVGFNVAVEPGERACQQTTLVDDAASATLLVGSYGRPVPPLTVSFAEAGAAKPLARAESRGGEHEGDLTFPLGGTVDGARTVRACVRNDGDVRVALGGDSAAPAGAAVVDGRPSGGVIALRFERAGEESWWQLMPTIATRFGIGKAGFIGAWTLPFAALLLLAVWVVTIRLLLKGGER